MKHFIYILIVLLMALFLYNLMAFREGLESCGAGQTNAAAQEHAQCSTVNSSVNNDLLAEVKKKLADLKSLYANTSKEIDWTAKNTEINNVNAGKLQNVADGNDNDNGEACKKYPDAC
jgi:hypothetical protein